MGEKANEKWVRRVERAVARTARNSEQEKSKLDKWTFLAGGLLAGAALVAAGGDVIPPWPAAVVWVAAWASFTYGLTGVPMNRWMRYAVSLVALWVGFSFWLSMTPRADIQIAQSLRLDYENVSEDEIAVNVVFRNRGTWWAAYRVYTIDDMVSVKDMPDRESKRRVEDRLHEALLTFGR